MDLIETTRQLGIAIQKSDLYADYLMAKDAMDQDAQLQELIGEFNLQKLNLSNAVDEEEEDSQRIQSLNLSVRDLYDRIMTNPVMEACSTAQDDLNRTLQFMQQILVGSANGQDPTMITEADCGGSCAGCAGCGPQE